MGNPSPLHGCMVQRAVIHNFARGSTCDESALPAGSRADYGLPGTFWGRQVAAMACGFGDAMPCHARGLSKP